MQKTFTFKQVVELYHIETGELSNWIAHRWVRPEETAEDFLFDDTDRARIALIIDLRRHLLVNDDTLALILSLLDQLYTTRRALKSVERTIDSLPEPMRAEIRARLRGEPRH